MKLKILAIIISLTLIFVSCNDNGSTGPGNTAPEISWTNLTGPYELTYDRHNRPWKISDNNGNRIFQYEYCGAKICGYTAWARFENTGASGTLLIKGAIRMDSGSEYMETTEEFNVEAGKTYEIEIDGTMKYSYLQNRTIVVSSVSAEGKWQLKVYDVHMSNQTGIQSMTLIETEK